MYARNAVRQQTVEDDAARIGHLSDVEAERISRGDVDVQDRVVRAECDFTVFYDRKFTVAVKVDLTTRLS